MTQTTTNHDQHRPAIMTTQQVADYLQVPVSTIYAWRHMETGPRALKVGKHLRWRRADIETWLDDQVA